MSITDKILKKKASVSKGYRLNIEITEDDAKREPLFCSLQSTHSVENTLVELGGHSPIQKTVLDHDKVITWANNNGIECWFDKEQRRFIFDYHRSSLF